MMEALYAINAMLLVLSGGYVFFVARYQYLTRNEEVDQALSDYKWSVLVASVAIFVSSCLFFLHDFDIIYRSQQRDLGFIVRILFAAQLFLAYKALKWAPSKKIIPLSIIFAVFVYVLEVLNR